MAEVLIYPGGGYCGEAPDAPCTGPDCGGTGGDDPCAGPNPPSSCSPGAECTFGCGGTNNCTGPDCVNNGCIGPDCSWGEDGEWHIYWVCNTDSGGLQQNEVIVGAGGLTVAHKFSAQEAHWDDSASKLGIPYISIGDAFTGSDIAVPGIVNPSGCYTYLGKKFGNTPGEVVANGITNDEELWAGVSATGGTYTFAIASCGNCTAPEPPVVTTGCQDPTACNYNGSAIVHDQDSCCYISGCVEDGALNYNSSACCDDGNCCYVDGCTDNTAINYNSDACYDDGSCCFVSGCTDSSKSNYDPLACSDDGSCAPDSVEFNYGFICTNNVGYCENSLCPPWGSNSIIEMFPIADLATLTNLNIVAGNTYSLGSNGHIQTTFLGVVTTNYEVGTVGGSYPGNGGIKAIGNGLPPYVLNNIAYGANLGDISNLQFIISHGSMGLIGTNFLLQNPENTGNTNAWFVQDSICACGTCCDIINTPCTDVTGCGEPLATNYNSAATIIDNTLCEWDVPRYCIPWDSASEDAYLYGDGSSASNPDLTTGTLKDNILVFQNYLYGLPAITTSSIPTKVFNVTVGGDGGSNVCFKWLGNDTYIGDGSILFNETDGFDSGPTVAELGPVLGAYPTAASIIAVDAACGGCNSNDKKGCTDPLAINYDIFAVIDDNTCNYNVISALGGCADVFASNYNAVTNNSVMGTCADTEFCLFPGCLDPVAGNYCSTCNVNDNLNCLYADEAAVAAFGGTAGTAVLVGAPVISFNLSANEVSIIITPTPYWNQTSSNSTAPSNQKYNINWIDGNIPTLCRTSVSSPVYLPTVIDAVTGVETHTISIPTSLAPSFFSVWSGGTIDIRVTTPSHMMAEALNGTSLPSPGLIYTVNI